MVTELRRSGLGRGRQERDDAPVVPPRLDSGHVRAELSIRARNSPLLPLLLGQAEANDRVVGKGCLEGT